MAAIQDQLITVLKKLNINLTEFSDLSFAGLCEEKSLQEFLVWFCQSFDSDNALNENFGAECPQTSEEAESIEIIPENVNGNFEDLFDDIQTSLEIRLDKDKAKLSELLLFENELIQTEKEVLHKFSCAKKNLAHAISNNNTEHLQCEIQNTLKICSSLKLFIPNLKSCEEASEKLKLALDDLFTSSVAHVLNQLNKEREARSTVCDNLEDILVQVQHEKLESVWKLNEAMNEVNNPALCAVNSMLETIPDFKDKSHEVVQRQLKLYEWICLRRELYANTYLVASLRLTRDLLEDALVLSQLQQFFIEYITIKTEMLNDLLTKFIDSVNEDSQKMEKIIRSCSEDVGSIIGLKHEGKDETHSSPMISCNASDHSVNFFMGMLTALKKEHNFHLDFIKVVEFLLSYLRRGPTLRFTPVPVDLMVLFRCCRDEGEKLRKQLRQLAGSFAEQKKSIRNSNRLQQLLWVYFLVDPSKLNATIRQRDESSFFHMTVHSDR